LPDHRSHLDLGKPNNVLDRPRRSATRQYRESSADGASNGARPEPEIVFNHLMEGIGLALVLTWAHVVTDLAGSVYSANLRIE